MNITIFPQPSNNTGGGSAEYTIGQVGIFNPSNVADGFSEPGVTLPLIDYPQLENIGYQTVTQGDLQGIEYTGFGGNIGLKPYSKTKHFFANGKDYIMSSNDDGAGQFYITIHEWDVSNGATLVNTVNTTQLMDNSNCIQLCEVKSDSEVLLVFGNDSLEYTIYNPVTNSFDTPVLSINNSTDTSDLSNNSRPFITYNQTSGKWLLFANALNSNFTPALVVFSTTDITDDTLFVKESESPNNEGIYYNEILNNNFYYNGSYYIYAFSEDLSTYSILKLDETNLSTITVFKDLINDLGITKSYLDAESTSETYCNIQIDETTGKLYLILPHNIYDGRFVFSQYDLSNDTYTDELIEKYGAEYRVSGYEIYKTNSELLHFFGSNRSSQQNVFVYNGENLVYNSEFSYVEDTVYFNFQKDSIGYNNLTGYFNYSGYDFSFFSTSEQIISLGIQTYNLPYDSVILPDLFINNLDYNFFRSYIYVGQPSTVN